MPIRPAEVHTAELLAVLKVPPASPHAAVHLAYMTQVRLMILEATVVPLNGVGAPLPLTAPPGTAGGPVTGTGSLT